MPPTMPTTRHRHGDRQADQHHPEHRDEGDGDDVRRSWLAPSLAPWRCARSSSSSFSSSFALFGWKSWFSVSMRLVHSSHVARTRVAAGDQREDHQPRVPDALRPDQRRRPRRLRRAAVLQRVAQDLERDPGDEERRRSPATRSTASSAAPAAARGELLMEDVDADVVAPHQRQAEGDRRADRQRIAAELVGALQRDVEELARDRLDRTRWPTAPGRSRRRSWPARSRCGPSSSTRSLRLGGIGRRRRRVGLRAARFISAPATGPTVAFHFCEQPGLDLSHDLGPDRAANLGHGAADQLAVGRASRHVDELELLAGGARVLAGVAVQRVLEQLLGVVPDLVGELVEGGLQLDLLVGLELVPGSSS